MSIDYLQEIREAEQAWLKAHRAVDVEALDALMHPDYVIIQPGGRAVDRRAILDSYRSGNRRWEYAEIDQLDIRIYGDTAVTVGRWHAKGENNGEKFDYSARYISVWIREEGRWLIAADQSTEID